MKNARVSAEMWGKHGVQERNWTKNHGCITGVSLEKKRGANLKRHPTVFCKTSPGCPWTKEENSFFLCNFPACGKTAAVNNRAALACFVPVPTVLRRGPGSPRTSFHKSLPSSSGISFSPAVFAQDQQVSAWTSSKGSCWSPTPSTSVSPSHVSWMCFPCCCLSCPSF